MPLGLQTAGVRLALATAICTAGQDLRLGAGQVD